MVKLFGVSTSIFKSPMESLMFRVPIRTPQACTQNIPRDREIVSEFGLCVIGADRSKVESLITKRNDRYALVLFSSPAL